MEFFDKKVFSEFKDNLKSLVKNFNINPSFFEDTFFINNFVVKKEDTPNVFLKKEDYNPSLEFFKKKYSDNVFFSLDGGSSTIFFDSSSLLGLVKIVLTYFNPVTFKKKFFISTFVIDVKTKNENFVINVKNVFKNYSLNDFNLDSDKTFFIPFVENFSFKTNIYSSVDNVVSLKNIEDTINFSRSYIEKLFLKLFFEKNFEKSFFLFYDGSLKEKYVEEKVFLDKIMFLQKNFAFKNNNFVVGFCKTSSLFSDFFSPEEKLFFKFKNYSSWLYLLKENSSNDDNFDRVFDKDFFVFFSKLHPKSNYVFRIDSFVFSDSFVNNLFEILVLNSYDPSFFGYPYILILNDSFARVTNNETSRYKVLLSSYSKKNFLKKTPHQILDSLEF